MENNKSTFWYKKDFLIKFANMQEGKAKEEIRNSDEYLNFIKKAYTIFPSSQRIAIYNKVYGKLEEELRKEVK